MEILRHFEYGPYRNCFEYAEGGWLDESNYKIILYFGDRCEDHRSDVYWLIGCNSELHLTERKMEISPQSLLGIAPDLTKEHFLQTVESLRRNSYEKPKLVSATIFQGLIPGHLSIQLEFEDGLCFQMGHLGYGQIVEILSVHPENYYLNKNCWRRAVLKNPNLELSHLLGISVLGQPRGSPPNMKYLEEEMGIDSEFLAANGLSEIFENLVQEMLNHVDPHPSPAPKQPSPAPVQSNPAPKQPNPDPLQLDVAATQQPNKSVPKECSICCNETEKLFVLVPCGHYPLCQGCSDSSSRCPYCRNAVERKIAVFDTNS